MRRGLAKSALGKKAEAIADYNESINFYPRNADAYFYRGVAQNNLGKKKEAIADYQKAAELYKEKGQTSDYQEAVNQIKKSLTVEIVPVPIVYGPGATLQQGL